MIQLRRSVRLKEEILLPNGERVNVNVDMEANAMKLNAALNDTIRAALAWQKEPESTALQDAFNAARQKYVHAILGDKAYEQACKAFDGDADELCTMLDAWLAERVHPLIVEASKRNLEKQQAQARKIMKKQRKRWGK